jgi:hypothetical protein
MKTLVIGLKPSQQPCTPIFLRHNIMMIGELSILG